MLASSSDRSTEVYLDKIKLFFQLPPPPDKKNIKNCHPSSVWLYDLSGTSVNTIQNTSCICPSPRPPRSATALHDGQPVDTQREETGAQLGVVTWHENKHQGVVYEKHSFSLRPESTTQKKKPQKKKNNKNIQ